MGEGGYCFATTYNSQMQNWIKYDNASVTKIWPEVDLFNGMSYKTAHVFVFSSALSNVQIGRPPLFHHTTVNQPFLHNGCFNPEYNKQLIWNLPQQSSLFNQQPTHPCNVLNPLMKMDVSTLTMSAFADNSASSLPPNQKKNSVEHSFSATKNSFYLDTESDTFE